MRESKFCWLVKRIRHPKGQKDFFLICINNLYSLFIFNLRSFGRNYNTPIFFPIEVHVKNVIVKDKAYYEWTVTEKRYS